MTSEYGDTERYADEAPPEDDRAYRTAEVWRAVGVGLLLIWLTACVLVVYWWVDATFLAPEAARPATWVRALGAPAAFAALLFAGWTAVSAVRLWRREPAGWDPLVVLGVTALAGAFFLVLPDFAVTGVEWGLVGVGVVSVGAALAGERAWRRAT